MDFYNNIISVPSDKVKFFKKWIRLVFTISSFQTQSMLLLHLISEVCRDIHLIFIDTRFVFPITCSFKNNVTKLLDLDVNEIESTTPLQLQKDEDIFFTI